MNQQLVRIDPTSLSRALIGFDRIFQDMENRFTSQINNNYPPYNVLKTDENTYEIQIAVSGFTKEEVSVEVDQDQLIIRGERKRADDASWEYLHRGLATRDFTRSFTLAEYMEVGSASINNGILSIRITKIIPDSLKPRKIAINGD